MHSPIQAPEPVIVGMAPLTMLPTAKVIVELLGFQVLAKESS